MREGGKLEYSNKERLKGYLASVNMGMFIQSIQIRDHKRTHPVDYMRDHNSLRERGIEFGFFEGNCRKRVVQSEKRICRLESLILELLEAHS